MSVERIIGIDFGTSTSVIRVKRYNNGQPVDDRLSEKALLFGNSPMVPTVIQRTDKGTYYGYDALISKKNETLFQNFKVDLENPDPVRRQEAKVLTEEFFVYIAKEYKSQSEGGYFGDPDDTERTIVSYPVKWNDETKAFLIKVAEEAGFKNVEGMDEAQAAIHAVIVQREDYLTKHGFFTEGVPCNILLIDMGAGTTDLVLCRHTPGKPPKNEMICTWPKAGDALFGGREVDEILREYIRSLLPEDQADRVLKNIGIKEFKTWKETVVSPALARSETVNGFSYVDNIVYILGINMKPYALDRSRFEKLAEEYLEKFPRLVKGCINKEEIDLVILTGGHSQWYFVKEMLINSIKVDLPKIRQNPDRVIPITRPQETVALGMVYRLLSVELRKLKLVIPTIETSGTSITEYYRKNIGSLVAYDNGWIVVKSDGTIHCQSRVYCRHIVDNWNNIASISCGNSYIVGLKRDGTVVAAGTGGDTHDQCNVQNWRGIVSVSCGSTHMVGLREDGTVIAAGSNNVGQCDVQDWRDIIVISCGPFHTVGLRKDGTVVAVGDSDGGNVQDWRDIVSISCGFDYTVGLRKDGTVVAVGHNKYGQCNVQNWRDIVSISCGTFHTIGLRKDGTVVEVGYNEDSYNVCSWNDIVAVCGAKTHTCGLKGGGILIFPSYKEYESTLSKLFRLNNCKRVPITLGFFMEEFFDE